MQPETTDRLDMLAMQVGRLSQADAGKLADILANRCGVHRDTAYGLLMAMAGWGWERTKEMVRG